MIAKRIAKSGATSYQVYSRASGRNVYVGSFPTERAARQAEQDHESTQRAIQRGELPPEPDRNRTFQEA